MKSIVASLSKILYHGTDAELKGSINPEMGSADSDFGRGFYLTDSYRKAKKRGKEKSRKSKKHQYLVIPVIFDDDACFSDSRVTHKHFQKDGEWLDYVMKNRLHPTDEKDWMIVSGPSIDGKMERITKHYEQKRDYSTLIKESGPDAYGEQYCFKDKTVTDKYLTPEHPKRHWRFW